MRVVGGELRGRRIDAPEGDSTRPTTDKVREAIFNALGSLGALDEARVVDLFAGSGALGIEALSRGAGWCSFVENDRRALGVLRGNITSLGLAERSSVLTVDLAAEEEAKSLEARAETIFVKVRGSTPDFERALGRAAANTDPSFN